MPLKKQNNTLQNKRVHSSSSSYSLWPILGNTKHFATMFKNAAMRTLRWSQSTLGYTVEMITKAHVSLWENPLLKNTPDTIDQSSDKDTPMKRVYRNLWENWHQHVQRHLLHALFLTIPVTLLGENQHSKTARDISTLPLLFSFKRWEIRTSPLYFSKRVYNLIL